MATSLRESDLDVERLRALLDAPVVSRSPAPAAEQTPLAERPAERTRKASRATWADAPFYLAALALALLLWVLGGYFTLVALSALGLPVIAAVGWPWALSQPALLSWLVPVAVSALELGFGRRRGIALLVFALVAGFDLGSTALGLHAWADRRVVLGLRLDAGAEGMLAGIGLAALGLTFLPERIAAKSVSALWSLVR